MNTPPRVPQHLVNNDCNINLTEKPGTFTAFGSRKVNAFLRYLFNINILLRRLNSSSI